MTSKYQKLSVLNRVANVLVIGVLLIAVYHRQWLSAAVLIISALAFEFGWWYYKRKANINPPGTRYIYRFVNVVGILILFYALYQHNLVAYIVYFVLFVVMEILEHRDQMNWLGESV